MSVLVIGSILLLTVLCALLYHPVDRHMKLEQVNFYESQKPVQPTFKALKDKDYYYDSSHRGSIVGSVGPITLDPRRLSKQLALQRKPVSVIFLLSNSRASLFIWYLTYHW